MKYSANYFIVNGEKCYPAKISESTTDYSKDNDMLVLNTTPEEAGAAFKAIIKLLQEQDETDISIGDIHGTNKE